VIHIILPEVPIFEFGRFNLPFMYDQLGKYLVSSYLLRPRVRYGMQVQVTQVAILRPAPDGSSGTSTHATQRISIRRLFGHCVDR
jgi:hypothetical protein